MQNEVQLCGTVPDALFKLPTSHMERLEKKIRKLRERLIPPKPTIAADEFNRGVSEAFIECMVSIFGNYRGFVSQVVGGTCY